MSKAALPFCVADISTFAKSLRRQIDGLETSPGHVEMLNLLAKAGGFRNFQHFRAQQQAFAALQKQQPASVPAEVNLKLVKKLVRYFDEQGRLIRWPGKFSQRMVCLWVMWSRLPARARLTEKEINHILMHNHLFADHALLRRELVDRKMVRRTADGRSYQRNEVHPSPEALALLEHLRNR